MHIVCTFSSFQSMDSWQQHAQKRHLERAQAAAEIKLYGYTLDDVTHGYVPSKGEHTGYEYVPGKGKNTGHGYAPSKGEYTGYEYVPGKQ